MPAPASSARPGGVTGGRATSGPTGLAALKGRVIGLVARLVLALQRVLLRVVPKGDGAVIATYPDFDDMLRALLPELRRRGTPVAIIRAYPEVERPAWVPDDVPILDRRTPRAFWAYLRAPAVYFTHGLYGSPEPVPSQVIANLWHGMPLKRIDPGLGVPGPGTTFTVATSRTFDDQLMASFRIGREDVELTGLPRNDLLTAGDLPDGAAICAELGVRGYLVMLPTFRSNPYAGRVDSSDDSLRIDPADLARLDALLREHDLAIVVKPHPISPDGVLDSWRSDRIVVVREAWLRERELTLYGLLAGSTALITDYSSVAVDYVVTDREILMYQADQAAYLEDRGIIVSREAMASLGPVATTPTELVALLQDAAGRGFARSIPASPEFWSVPPSGATQRVVDAVERRLAAR